MPLVGTTVKLGLANNAAFPWPYSLSSFQLTKTLLMFSLTRTVLRVMRLCRMPRKSRDFSSTEDATRPSPIWRIIIMTRDLLFRTSLMFTTRYVFSRLLEIPSSSVKHYVRRKNLASVRLSKMIFSACGTVEWTWNFERDRGKGRLRNTQPNMHPLKRIHHEPLSHILNEIRRLLPVAQFPIRVDAASSARRICKLFFRKVPFFVSRHLYVHTTRY